MAGAGTASTAQLARAPIAALREIRRRLSTADRPSERLKVAASGVYALIFAVVCAQPVFAQSGGLAECECPPELRDGLSEVLTQAESGASDMSPRARAQRLESIAVRYLRAQGYLEGAASSIIDRAGAVSVRIETGRRYTVGSVVVAPARLDRPSGGLDLQSHAESIIQPGAPARAETVLDAEAELLSLLHENGYITALVEPRDAVIRRARGVLDVTLRLTPGSYATLGAAEAPSGRLDDRLLAVLETWRRGDPARRSDLAAFSARVEALESVRLARLSLATDAPPGEPQTVQVSVAPEAPSRIEGSVGYASSEGVGINGRYLHRDLTGLDERLRVTAKLGELESELTASLMRPHFRTYGRMLEFTGKLSDSRTDAFDADAVEAIVSVLQQFPGPFSAGAGAGLAKVNGRDLFGELDSTIVFASFSGNVDRRDDPLDPTRGVYLGLSFQPAYNFATDGSLFARALAEARAYWDSGSITFAGRLRTGALIGADARAVPPNYRFYAGGGGSVRGYAYQSLSPSLDVLRGLPARDRDRPDFEYFGGDSLLEASLEARWRPQDQNLGYVLFVDTGTASLERVPQVSSLRYAAGVGLRYHTDFGPLRVDLAAPIDPRPDDDPVQLYISIGQAF